MNVERDAVSLGPFEFECGGTVPDLTVAYEAYGEGVEPRSTGDRTESGSDGVVLLCHALTGSQRVVDAGSGESRSEGHDAEPPGSDQARAWWDDVVGPGKAVDTDRYRVVCANVPGSCYGTTGPASTDPETGEPYGAEFPPVTVGDWTRAQRRLLDRLGVGDLRAVVGGSVGGMNALDWARRYPDDVRRVVPIAAAARLDSQCLALDAVARRAVTSDPDWRGGDYYGETHPDRGLGLARQLGHVAYLSKASMAEKFGRRASGRGGGPADGPFPADPSADAFPYREVESYLDHQARRFVDRFDANSYLYLTRAMDEFDLAAGRGSDAGALAGFDGEALVVSFVGDWHFTVAQSEALARAFRAAGAGVVHRVVDSDHGHDAFLAEPERVGPPLRRFLDRGVAGVAGPDGVDGRAFEDGEGCGRRFAPVHASLFP